MRGLKKTKKTKKGNSLNRGYKNFLKDSKLITGVVKNTTSLSYIYANAVKIIISALESKIIQFL